MFSVDTEFIINLLVLTSLGHSKITILLCPNYFKSSSLKNNGFLKVVTKKKNYIPIYVKSKYPGLYWESFDSLFIKIGSVL